MRLLIVEDDTALRTELVRQLTAEGYAVDSAADGRDGLFMANEYAYDLAIIDLGLPQIDGISLITQLRKSGRDAPILVLTARDAWQDKVKGLEAGADDYLTKPFHPQELRARIQALLRRAHGAAQNRLEFAPLVIDTDAKTVTLKEQPIELTSYEYNTLLYLALNAGKTLSKTELTEHLYAQDYDRDSNVIEVFIGRLRKKLDPDGSLAPISTLRGLGYRFNLPPSPAQPQ
ncbi:response regulator transcription factor [Gilvimarinus polysaccharolyticus]|uniref:response regulator transcription factor n=1 Tax=Gilvimarinus polysaccharolyticus TaxID=863921 RepID=UPI000673C44F|nr:response regulator transcription factor [Gilvimarinus polysaccharolyticus]